MAQDLLSRFQKRGPKRILCLDGGGTRGILALENLEKIERILEARHGRPVPLHEYFDLIAGTSTGAIIAAALAIGKRPGEIKQKYIALGRDIFGDKRSLFNPFDFEHWLSHQFDHDKLERHLKGFFGEIELGAEAIKTGLAIVAKRADTNSTWVFFNHPEGMYYKKGNDKILLRDLVRASSAAPTYFLPCLLKVKADLMAAFVDGGISFSNNPSIIALLLATAKAFPFRWELGADRLFLVSVGTGFFPVNNLTAEDVHSQKMLKWAKALPNMLLQDANVSNQMLMQWMTDSPTSVAIDREMGALENDLLAGRPLFSYARYSVEMSLQSLGLLGFEGKIDDQMLEKMADMASIEYLDELPKIGSAYADRSISKQHFPEAFDLGRPARPAFRRNAAPPVALRAARPKSVEAVQMDKPFEVERADGSFESGNAGDWAVLGADGEWRVVEMWDFKKNYDIADQA